jgi:hypothetical protein
MININALRTEEKRDSQFADLDFFSTKDIKVTTLVAYLTVGNTTNPKIAKTELESKEIIQFTEETDSNGSSDNDTNSTGLVTKNHPKFPRCHSANSLELLEPEITYTQFVNLLVSNVQLHLRSINKKIEQQDLQIQANREEVLTLSKTITKQNEYNWDKECRERHEKEQVEAKLRSLERAETNRKYDKFNNNH